MEKLTVNNNLDLDGSLFSKDDLLNLYRLQKELLQKENMVATLSECANIWANYSSDLCAGWLFFPKNDQSILDEVKACSRFKSIEEYCL